jgi:hypothetical protein
MADNNDTADTAASRWYKVKWLFQVACFIAATTIVLALSKDRLLKLFPPMLTREYLIYVLENTLLITVIILILLWVFAVNGEMEMLQKYFREYIRSQPRQVSVYAILFSFLLGVLGWAADNIIAFSLIFAVYAVGDMWGQWLRNRQLKEALRQIAREGSDNETLTSKRQAIERYYLERPQMERSATVMFFAFVALSLALVGNASNSIETKDWLHAAAYVIIIADVAISEIVIWRWRKIRDAVLDGSYSH